jgi:RNA polymerase sigma-70 factor (ECF subfamily)
MIDARRRASMRGLELVARPEPAGDDPYEGVVARLDGSALVVRALAHLTPDQRNVVLLRSVAHLSVAETADVLHKRAGAVKTLHRRGLAALARVVGSAEAVS